MAAHERAQAAARREVDVTARRVAAALARVDELVDELAEVVHRHRETLTGDEIRALLALARVPADMVPVGEPTPGR